MSSCGGQWSGWHRAKGSCSSPFNGQHSPVMFLRVPRSSSSQATSELGSAAQEWPEVSSAARSATQARSWPSTSTSCHHDEALKAATSSMSPQAGNGRWHAGSPQPPARHGMGDDTKLGSQNQGLMSGEPGQKIPLWNRSRFSERDPLRGGQKREHQVWSLKWRWGRSPVSARVGHSHV